MKFVHAADLHLDSPLSGLEQYDGAPVERIRGATRGAFKNLIELCLEEEVALLLLAGDLYDGDWDDYSTALFFSAEMSRLRQANVRVVWIRGNHDAASRITQRLRLPDNVRELPVREPGTIELGDLGVAVHGQGYADRAVTADLSVRYPERRPGMVNLGLLHTALAGRPGHEPYAPCSLQALVEKGYDYFALGHVHQREEVCREPWVVFPGNLQGRHARETGEKGATLVSVEGDRIRCVEHRTLDVVRWGVCEVDAEEATSADDVVDLATLAVERAREAAGDRLLAARLIVRGATRAHGELCEKPEHWLANLRAVASDAGGEGVWLEKVQIKTHEPGQDLAELAQRDDAVGELLASLRNLRVDPEALEALAEARLTELKRKLPPALTEGPEALGFDGASLAETLGDVERLLLPRLLLRGPS